MTNNKKTWLDKDKKSLFDTISKIDSADFMGDFFRDICTIKEIEAMSERWKVCKLLDKGLSYREINKQTGVSTTTITRIAYWMKHGNGGYTKALKLK